VTSDPLADQRAAPATELAEAVEAQIREVREVLRADAEAVGMDPELVDAAVDAAAASFGGARVHAFIGILVEPRYGRGSGWHTAPRTTGRATTTGRANRPTRPTCHVGVVRMDA
jgi:hypothetical protein